MSARMKKIETALPEVFLIEPEVHGDDRGWFFESYRRDKLAGLGIEGEFVQDNHSKSSRGVLRGLHFQLGKPQGKLIRVVEGEIFDVAVDVRRGSPRYGKWAGAKLTGESKRMMYVPAGFAHGFTVMSETAEIIYKCTDYYAPEEERGVLWSDPAIGIEWPMSGTKPVLSAKDRAYTPLSEIDPSDLPEFNPS